MTRALVVSYYFPPLGGAGVQRTCKFARYLPDFGVTPSVVAGPTEGATRWEPKDEGLVDELGKDLAVYRPAGKAVVKRGRLRRWTGRPTGVEGWWREALVEPAERAIADTKPDVLFVTMSPFAALEPVLQLGKKHGLPVVADLRDPWALDEIFVYPSRWHRSHAIREMGRALARADQVVLNTPETRAVALEAFPKLDPERVHVITNGYDARDFQGLAARTADGRTRILHTGYLHTAFGMRHRRRSPLKRALGGEACEVDYLGRSHFYLLAALRRLAERGVSLEALELHLLGVLSDADLALLKSDCPLADAQIFTPGYVDHATTVRAQVEADLLFLPMHVLPAGRRARIVPGKTYEYLASGTPILAAVPEGDARDFVRSAEAGTIVAPDDVEGLADAIEVTLANSTGEKRELGAAITRFERRELTRRLADVLQKA